MEKNLQKIRNIKETGLFFKGLNITSAELLDIINNITSSEEIWNFPEIVGKYATVDLLNMLANKDLYGSSMLSNFEEKFIQNIPKELFRKLEPKTLSSFTADQFKNIDKVVINDLLQTNKLQYLSNEVLNEMDIDFDYKYSINIVSNKPDFDVVKKQIESLEENNKLQMLSDKSLENIVKDNYLIKVINNLNNFNERQLEIIEKNLSNLNPDAIKSLTPETLDRFKTFPNFTSQQLKYLNNKSLKHIINKNPDFVIEEKDKVQPIISEKIKNIMELNDKTNLNYNDINYSIDEFLKNESYDKISLYCVDLSRQDNTGKIIKQVLNKKINECKNNIYGNIDKINMLKTLILVDDDKKNHNKNFANLTGSIKNISTIKPRTIDGYFSKSKLYSSLLLDDNFDFDFQEKLAEENLKNIDDCIKENYSVSERNSLDTPLKQLKAQSLMEYANVLVKKYNINLDKFKNINEENKKFLNKQEKICYNSIKEAIELEPNIESTVKSWATPILKIATKGVLTYLGTKATTGKVSTAIGIAGTLMVANDIKNEFDKKNYFLNPDNYHKKERTRKENFWDNITKIKNLVVSTVCYPFKKVSNFFKKDEDLKGFEREDSNTPIQIQSTLFKKNMCKNSCKDILNLKVLEHNKNISDLQSDLEENNRTKIANLIKQSTILKKKALEIKTQRKVEDLYLKYPQFKDQGICKGYFNRMKEAITGTAKGIVGSFFDVATLGVGSDIYQKFVDNEADTQRKFKNKMELEKLQKELDAINKKSVDKLNKINQEECEQLSVMNDEDKYNLQSFLDSQKEEFESLQNYFNKKYKSVSMDDRKENSLKFGDKTRKFDKSVLIHLNSDNQILDKIEDLESKDYNVKNYLDAKNQLLDLLQYGDVADEILLKNSLKFKDFVINEMNKGQINPEEAKVYIQPIEYIEKNFGDQNVVDEMIKNYDNQDDMSQSKFVNKYQEKNIDIKTNSYPQHKNNL